MLKVGIAIGLFLYLEIYLIGQVMDQWGVLTTLLLLALTAVLGSRLVKREGVATVQNMAIKLQQGAAVGLDLVEGGVLLIAGFLFVFPGFLSDGLALLLLLPPVRRWVAVTLVRAFRQGGGTLHGQAVFVDAGGTIIDGESTPVPDSPTTPVLQLPPPGTDPSRRKK